MLNLTELTLTMQKKMELTCMVDIYNNVVAMSLMEPPVSDDYIARID